MNHMTPEEILDQMEELFPDAHCELNHRNAYELLVAVVLSAQTTDASVNRVTPALFARFPTPQDMAAADEEEIGSYIRSIGPLPQQGPLAARAGAPRCANSLTVSCPAPTKS